MVDVGDAVMTWYPYMSYGGQVGIIVQTEAAWSTIHLVLLLDGSIETWDELYFSVISHIDAVIDDG